MGIPDRPQIAEAAKVDLADAAAPQSPIAVQEQRLSTVFEIATILATEHDLGAMLSRFMACLTDTLEAAEFGVLLLYDSADESLKVRASKGYDLELLKTVRLLPGEGSCGKAFQSGTPKLYRTEQAIAAAREDLMPENRAVFLAATAELPRAQSSVCIPLISDRTKIGVLMLENLRRPNGFAQADLAFLNAVAGLITLSVENVRLKEELRATAALREANRLKTELISTLSHEMRTPLTSIKGFSTALLMEDASFSPETRQGFLQTIDEECDVLEELIHDLLESSIIDSGLLKLEPQPVRLPRLVDSAVSDSARRTDKHQFVVDFPEGFPIVDADPHRVAQVLRNLLDNSVKYSPQGGLIVVRGEVLEHEVVISVADQGVGLAPEHVNRLFERGFRVKSGLIRHIAGSGLGLPICQTIVESHGGRIWAESEIGQGTTLSFTIPLGGLTRESAEQLGGLGD